MGETAVVGPGWLELQRARRAIVVVDVVESVRLMQAHEEDVIDRWRRFVAEVRTQVLPGHRGRLVKSLGDGLLLEFELPAEALAAALELQRRIAVHNDGLPEDAVMRLRVGMHVADVVVDELDVWGTGVNTAARIANLAAPGEVVVSVEARDELADGLDGRFDDLGECFVKHMDAPLRVYRVGHAERPPAPAPTMLATSVAVLPFAAPAAGAESLALGDLLSDQVSASLSRSANLTVVSRFSAATVAGRGLGARECGRLLGAAYLVAGRAYLNGGQVVLVAELLEAKAESVVWQNRFDAPLADVLAGADALVPALVAEVGRAIVEREVGRASTLPLPSLESHRLLMAAVGHIHRCSPRDFARAQDLLEVVAERHRRSPQAFAWLAQWHAMSVVQGLSADPDEAARRALDHAQRALDADDSSSLALTMKGLVLGFLRHELDAADAHYAQALALNPNEALAWLYTGTLRAWQGRGDEALQAARRSLALAPWDPLRYHFDSLAGLAALAAGELALAAEWSQRSLRANRRHTSTHRTLAVAQWRLGQHDAARATVADMMRVEPAFTVRRYLARFPGGATALALDNAAALAAAGAPAL